MSNVFVFVLIILILLLVLSLANMKMNIHEKLKRGISQEYSSSYKQATRQAKKLL